MNFSVYVKNTTPVDICRIYTVPTLKTTESENILLIMNTQALLIAMEQTVLFNDYLDNDCCMWHVVRCAHCVFPSGCLSGHHCGSERLLQWSALWATRKHCPYLKGRRGQVLSRTQMCQR